MIDAKNNFSKTTNENIERIVVLGFGTWDAAFRNIKYYFRFTTKILSEFFSSIKGDPTYSQVKFYVLTAPAWKERSQENRKLPLKRRNLRNNALLAALVSLTFETLKGYPNVFLVDYYSMSLSRSNEMVDNYHYIVPQVKKKNVSMVGPVGMTAAKVLLENICEHN